MCVVVCVCVRTKCLKNHTSRSPTSPTWQEDEIAPGPGNASTASYSKQSYSDTIDTRSLSIDPMENMKPSPNHPFLYGDQTESLDDPNKTLTAAADSPKTYDHMSSSVGGGSGKELLLQNDYDADGNTETETKSVSSIKSNGSIQELRYFFFFSFFVYNFAFEMEIRQCSWVRRAAAYYYTCVSVRLSVR